MTEYDEKKLIVGLGNDGKEYEYTRHNIGFIMLDFFASKNKATFNKDKYAYISEIKNNNTNLYLIKPTTYMNKSGIAVDHWLKELNIKKKDILILVDDINLPFATLRLRIKGSSGGHNGLKNIEEFLGQDYARLRFGIGHNFETGEQNKYVLGYFNNEEKEQIKAMKEQIIKDIQSFTQQSIEQNIEKK